MASAVSPTAEATLNLRSVFQRGTFLDRVDNVSLRGVGVIRRENTSANLRGTVGARRRENVNESHRGTVDENRRKVVSVKLQPVIDANHRKVIDASRRAVVVNNLQAAVGERRRKVGTVQDATRNETNQPLHERSQKSKTPDQLQTTNI